MTNVKTIFFLTKEEANKIHACIDYRMPQYELEDGRTMYAHTIGIYRPNGHSYDTLDSMIDMRKAIARIKMLEWKMKHE